MSYEMLLVESKDNVEIIILNRPRVLNSLCTQLMTELDKAFAKAMANKKVRVIVITGAGRAFAAGKDIAEFVGKGGEGMSAISTGDHQILTKIRKAWHWGEAWNWQCTVILGLPLTTSSWGNLRIC